MSGFPSNPPIGTTYGIGQVTWQWNGYAWQVLVSTIGGVCGPAGPIGPTGSTGNGVTGFGVSGDNLYYWYMNANGQTFGTFQNAGYVRGPTGNPGSGGITLFGGTSISITSGPSGITVSYTGVAGAGNTGATGATGNPPGIPYNYQIYSPGFWIGPDISSVSLRNSQAGATLIEISVTDANSKDVTTFLESWDDSTNPHKGYLHIQNRFGTKYHVYGITGNSTSEGLDPYFTFNLIPSFTGGFTFATGESVYLFFSRSGNVGAQGPAGSGSAGGVTLFGGTGIDINSGSAGITISTQDIFVRNDGDSMSGALSISTAATTSASSSLSVSGNLGVTSNTAVNFVNFNQTIAPATNSLSDYRSFSISNRGDPPTSVTISTISGLRSEGLRWGDTQTGAVTTIRGIYTVGSIIDTVSVDGVTATTITGLHGVGVSRITSLTTGYASVARGLYAIAAEAGGWTIPTAVALQIDNPVDGNSITSNIGINVGSMTRGSNSNYGIQIAAPAGSGTNAAVRLSDTSGDVGGGILFGSDTNLYRSAANVLRTDDALSVGGTFSASNISGTNTGDQIFFAGTSITLINSPAGITISYTGVGGSGTTGATGATGISPGIKYEVFNGTDLESNMDVGLIALKNNPLLGATLLYIATEDINNKNQEDFIKSWDDSTNSHKGYLQISNIANTKYQIYGITGSPEKISGASVNYYEFNLIPSFTGGYTFSDYEDVTLWFTRSGDRGADGAPGSGGGAAGTKTYSVFTPLDNEPPASDYATIDTRNSISFLSFVGTTAESAIFRSVIPQGATFTSLSAILYYGTTGSTGNIVWCAQFENMIGQTLNSDGFATAICATGPVGATFLSGLTLTTSNINGITSGDPYRVKIYRDGASANDTHVQDAQLFTVEIRGA